ncbi:glycine receptor subunit alpha-2-like [Bacillus rossius redtenbacheri]|uniref:glycine receptor subunit alpha-2-like n=1 Tax=Bacillus rossius redtenbacheri TaxID=93214 RepID=UPI002FDE2E36
MRGRRWVDSLAAAMRKLAVLQLLVALRAAMPTDGAKIDHLQILDSLLKNDYDRRATPTNHLNKPTSVTCELYIRSFGSISPVTMDYEVDLYLRQKWQDERLKHAEITEALDLNDPNLVKAIWKPEVYFPNAKHAEFQYVTVPNVLVRINPDGEILYMLRLKLTFSCMMDLSKFPLDSQVCTMEVASFSKTIEELSLDWKTMNPVIMGKDLRMPQFEIVKIAASDCQETFQIGNYSCLVAEFHLSRSVGFHLVQSYLPTILIVVISWVSFWMDVDSVPGRTTLGVTTLLAVSSQSSGIQSGLPQVSYVKAIDVWMGTCSAFVFCALLEFTFVNYMWRKPAPAADMGRKRRRRKASKPLNGRTAARSSDDEQDAAISLNMRKCPSEESPCASCGQREEADPAAASNKVMARRIDELSRLFFPLTFIVFNVIYWSFYLS